MVNFLKPGMVIGTPARQAMQNKHFTIIPSWEHAKIYRDALTLPFAELRERHTLVEELASAAMRKHIEGLKSAEQTLQPSDIVEPELKFVQSASYLHGNTLYFGKIVHVGRDYILIERPPMGYRTYATRYTVKKDQVQSVEWAPPNLSDAVRAFVPKKS